MLVEFVVNAYCIEADLHERGRKAGATATDLHAHRAGCERERVARSLGWRFVGVLAYLRTTLGLGTMYTAQPLDFQRRLRMATTRRAGF